LFEYVAFVRTKNPFDDDKDNDDTLLSVYDSLLATLPRASEQTPEEDDVFRFPPNAAKAKAPPPKRLLVRKLRREEDALLVEEEEEKVVALAVLFTSAAVVVVGVAPRI
jgi:hypothetical protein